MGNTLAAQKKKTTTKNAAASKKEAPVKSKRKSNGNAMAITIVVLLVLAILMLIGFFAEDAAVLRLLCDAVKYLVGAGFFTLPFVLIAVAFDLLLHFKRRNNVFRLFVLSSVPFFVGAIAHVFTASERYSSAGAILKDGLTYKSGGLIAGGISELLVKAITRLGAGIVLGVIFVLLLLVAVNITLTQIAESAGHRLERAKDKTVEQHKYRRAERQRQREIARTQREQQLPLPAPSTPKKGIDIPLDAKRRIDIPLDGYSTAPTGAFAAPNERIGSEIRQESAAEVRPVIVAEPPRTEPKPQPVRVSEPKITVAEPKKPVEREPDPIPVADDPEPAFREAHHTASDDLAVLRVRGVAPPPTVSPDVFQPVAKQPPAEKSARERMRVTMTKDELEDEIAQVNEAAEIPVAQEYRLPPIELLKTEPQTNLESAEAEMRQNADKLIRTLASFNLDAQIVGVTRGPSVTRYEVQLSSGTRSSKLMGLADDISLALAAQSIRIAPIPNKSAIGIEVPNKVVTMVYLRDVIESREFKESRSQVTFALGNDIAGQPVVSDISRLPHMLVGGTTNSGKSVCINSLLISLIYKSRPDEVRLILIDPKMVEFASYNGIPPLLIPVVTDPKKAAGALQWAVTEMMQRYKRFNELGVRNFTEYNDACDRFNAAAAEEAAAQAEADEAPFDLDESTGEVIENVLKPSFEKMARIVIVIDELADLMIVSPGEVEESICRIAQMARAAGMHLIVATQRPSADVITGLMKANIPSRIAFSVASGMESRIILDQIGAERLIGRGDMLFSPIGSNKPTRIQGCYVSSAEIDAVVEYVKSENAVEYSSDVLAQVDRAAQNVGGKKGRGGSAAAREESGGAGDDDVDELFNDAVSIAVESGRVSTSMLQTRLKLGYARAARIVDQMESCGIIGPFEGQKPRQILISKEDWAEMRYRRENME